MVDNVNNNGYITYFINKASISIQHNTNLVMYTYITVYFTREFYRSESTFSEASKYYLDLHIQNYPLTHTAFAEDDVTLGNLL